MGDLIRLHANHIGTRSVDQEPGFDPLSPAPASCPPIDLERAARATRDAGMQQALRPDLFEQLRQRRPSYFAELREDWADIISEVRGSPLVAILTVVIWTALLVVPTLVLK
jgi:hypothetical protein